MVNLCFDSLKFVVIIILVETQNFASLRNFLIPPLNPPLLINRDVPLIQEGEACGELVHIKNTNYKL